MKKEKEICLHNISELHKKYLVNLVDINIFQGDMTRACKSFEFGTEDFISSLKMKAKNPVDVEMNSRLFTSKQREEVYPELVCEMSFIYLISIFEAYFNDATFYFFRYFIKNLMTDKKSITYKQILEAKSINSIKNKIIEIELYQLGYLSMKDKLNYLERKFNLKFDYTDTSNPGKEINIKRLVEIFSTRNIILHNGAIVNEKYLLDNSDSKLKIGVKRKINHKYFQESVFELISLGTQIAMQYIKKIE